MECLGDDERVRRGGDEHLSAEVAEQHRLSGGLAARHGDDGGADALAALVEAEAAGEQAVAVGVVDEHPGADAGHRHRARHELGPRLEVGARVADYGRLAVAAARGLDAHDLLARNGEQPERIVLAQVVLLGERDAREVIEGGHVAGVGDAGLPQSLGTQGLVVQHAVDRRAPSSRPRRPRTQTLRRSALQCSSRFRTSAGLRWQ